MRVSKIISREQFNKAIQDGIYTIIPSIDAEIATQKSKDYKYYKVEYLNLALYKSVFYIAVHS